jgi:hypothetical protein
MSITKEDSRNIVRRLINQAVPLLSPYRCSVDVNEEDRHSVRSRMSNASFNKTFIHENKNYPYLSLVVSHNYLGKIDMIFVREFTGEKDLIGRKDELNEVIVSYSECAKNLGLELTNYNIKFLDDKRRSPFVYLEGSLEEKCFPEIKKIIGDINKSVDSRTGLALVFSTGFIEYKE